MCPDLLVAAPSSLGFRLPFIPGRLWLTGANQATTLVRVAPLDGIAREVAGRPVGVTAATLRLTRVGGVRWRPAASPAESAARRWRAGG